MYLSISPEESAMLAPTQPPRCSECGKVCSSRITRSSNRKGNAGRSYFICIPCDKFAVFADTRGNDPTNPPCHCGLSSKRQVSGDDKAIPRNPHYVCRRGECDFFQRSTNTAGIPISIEEEIIGRLALLSIL